MHSLLWFLGVAASIAVAVWAFWEPIMKVTKSWLESVEAYRKAKKAGIEVKTAKHELEQVTKRSEEKNEDKRNQLLLQEARDEQKKQYPRGNITWPESWYRENFKRLSKSEMDSFISFLKRERKL